jgi:NAD(P)-dependent dehydrogenase (short-subunit alcohol dehydrogenase family)
MTPKRSTDIFSLAGRVAALTGGGGVLCGAIAAGYARAGTSVFLLDIDEARTRDQAERLCAETGSKSIEPLHCDVLDRASIEAVLGEIVGRAGRIDILVNGAGGNHPKATTNPADGVTFADLPEDAFRRVFELNLMGTVLCSQVFGKTMAEQAAGCIINIASMAGITPLTRVPAYSAAKAAVISFTQWLAVDLAQNASPKIRVNAIAPGFFDTAQNHFLLYAEKGGEEQLTDRGKTIIAATPQGAFGEPEDLVGAAIWLASDSAAFVTGAVIPIDGGFSAFSGV